MQLGASILAWYGCTPKAYQKQKGVETMGGSPSYNRLDAEKHRDIYIWYALKMNIGTNLGIKSRLTEPKDAMVH